MPRELGNQSIIDPKRLLDPLSGAKYLLGAIIVRTMPNGHILMAKIVETECYHQLDPASHTFNGQTPRNQVMFGPPGRAYVYFTYGIHWCFNVTAGEVGDGAGILIRAAEPIAGLDIITTLRKNISQSQLTNGPAKLAQALSIDNQLYAHDLRIPPLQIRNGGQIADQNITATSRIGIKVAMDEPLRFYISDSPYISKR